MLSCAGIADRLLQIPSQSDVLKDARLAAKICIHARIAASSFPAQEAIAAKQTPKSKMIKGAQISATGFRWTKNTGAKVRDR